MAVHWPDPQRVGAGPEGQFHPRHELDPGTDPIVSGERERAIGLPSSAGWCMDPLAKHNRSWYIGAGAVSDNQAAALFFW